MNPEFAPCVLYVLQSRRGKRGLRTRRDQWFTECVFLTRTEAERFAKDYKRRFFHGWRVEPVAAAGELVKRLANTNTESRAA